MVGGVKSHYNYNDRLSAIATAGSKSVCGRISTFLRASGENIHAAFYMTYNHLRGMLHHTRFDAIGHAFNARYNRLYGENYGIEWEETSLVWFEYLAS